MPFTFPWEDDNAVINGEGSWDGKTLHRNGRHRGLSIAGWDALEKVPILTTGHPKGKRAVEEDFVRIDSNSTYILHLKWLGEVDGRGMEPYETEYFLKFDGKNFELREVESVK